MKRIIIDFDQSGPTFSRRLYHPFTTPSEGIQSFGPDPITNLEKDLFSYLQEVPLYDETISQSNPTTVPGYAFVHISRLEAYESTILSLKEEIAKLKPND